MPTKIDDGNVLIDETIDYAALTKRIAIESALLAAHNALESYNAARADVEPEDPLALERQTRNAVLAGNGEKAKLLGDLTSPPTYDRAALEAAGFEPAMALAISADAARIRSAAVALDDLIRGEVRQ